MRLIKRLSVGRSLLDIGCGNGAFCLQCAELSNTKKVYGLDAASVANKHVKKHDKIEYFDSWAWEIPLPDNSVDAIVTCEVLEHVPEDYVKKTFKEFYRVTKYAVYGTVCTGLSGEKYSDGENAHMCVQNKHWWKSVWEKVGFETKGTTPSKNHGFNFTIIKEHPDK